MTERGNIREERIERLLKELQYEITRGMLEGDIDERLGFRFYVPTSKTIADGVVLCEFRTKPIQRYEMDPANVQPRLRVVPGGRASE